MAGQIPTQFIDELLARVDIVDIIDTRVPLKKAGKNLHACCPFHNEKTPSFTVSQEKQFYHCFGCGAHGTAIGFLMEYDQLSFPEAIQELADHVGMTVPTTQQASLSPVKQSLYDLMDKVGQYYVHQLQTHPQRQAFVDYLKRRGLSQKTVELFGIMCCERLAVIHSKPSSYWMAVCLSKTTKVGPTIAFVTESCFRYGIEEGV